MRVCGEACRADGGQGEGTGITSGLRVTSVSRVNSSGSGPRSSRASLRTHEKSLRFANVVRWRAVLNAIESVHSLH